ncbi:MAG: hypothetical protein OXC62_02590 [Aestuariivita sp.]|nr:hypothetical protein [Aestuariivita sp.]
MKPTIRIALAVVAVLAVTASTVVAAASWQLAGRAQDGSPVVSHQLIDFEHIEGDFAEIRLRPGLYRVTTINQEFNVDRNPEGRFGLSRNGQTMMTASAALDQEFIYDVFTVPPLFPDSDKLQPEGQGIGRHGYRQTGLWYAELCAMFGDADQYHFYDREHTGSQLFRVGPNGHCPAGPLYVQIIDETDATGVDYGIAGRAPRSPFGHDRGAILFERLAR